MDACENCGNVAEYEVLSQGDYLKLCSRCVTDDMVIVTKPTKAQVEWSYKRPTVRQLLTGMSGHKGNSVQNLPNTPPTLSMLRAPSKDSAMKTRLTNMKLASPDAARHTIDERAPKCPSPAANISPEKKNELESEDDFLDI
jgi:hypothetical protein